MSTARLELRYRKAQKALERAERRATNARRAVEAATKKAEERRAQRDYDRLLLIAEDRRRELREIELLMMPADYNGRDSRRRDVRHESGEIVIPLGETTGIRKRPPKPPTFPVTVSTVRS